MISYVEMLGKKIKFELWKATIKIVVVQQEMFNLSKRSFFPLKDPGHCAKINIIIGKELPEYPSRVHFRLQKKPVKMGSSINHKEEVWLKVKVITSGPE